MVEKIEEQTYLEIKSEQQRIRKSIHHIYICTSPYLPIYHVKPPLFSHTQYQKKIKPLTKKAHTIRNPHKTFYNIISNKKTQNLPVVKSKIPGSGQITHQKSKIEVRWAKL